jgi:flavin reductase (DIM6/NTAB) family NADH-FMN oxidoreductase RutF
MKTLEAPAIRTHALRTQFRRAAGFIPSGVAVLSGGGTLMTVSSFHAVSSDPPWVSVSLERESRKGRVVVESGSFRATLLKAEEESFARGGDLPSDAGVAVIECVIRSVHEVGDHSLVLAEVTDAEVRGGSPLLYWRRGLHPFAPRYAFIETRASFDDFVARWEGGRLPRLEWSHAAHVGIGASYVVRFGGNAMDELRRGIQRHNLAAGVSPQGPGYHETLTRFWCELLARVIDPIADPWSAARAAVDRFGEERDLHRLYYSFDVARDRAAREIWVPPDLDGRF